MVMAMDPAVILILTFFLPLLAGSVALFALRFLRGPLPLIGVPLALGSFAVIVGGAFFSTGSWSTRGLDAQAFLGIVLVGAWFVLIGTVLLIGCLSRVATFRGPKAFWPPGLLVAVAMALLIDGVLFAVGPRAFPTNLGPGVSALPIGNLLIPLSVVIGEVVLVAAWWGCGQVQHGRMRGGVGDRDSATQQG